MVNTQRDYSGSIHATVEDWEVQGLCWRRELDSSSFRWGDRDREERFRL